MALQTCPECGHNMSSTAPSCPTCGFVPGAAAPPRPVGPPPSQFLDPGSNARSCLVAIFCLVVIWVLFMIFSATR